MLILLFLFSCRVESIQISNDQLYGNKLMPYLKTFAESKSTADFIGQFRMYERQNQGNSMRKSKSESSTKSVAQQITDDLDMTVNPCDNFYLFACGGYIQRSNTTNGVVNSFQQPGSRISDVVKEELQRDVSTKDPIPLIKAKLFFKSCMDEQSIERRGLLPILQFLTDRGGWPVLGRWNDKSFHVIDQLAETRPLISDGEFHYVPSGTIIGMVIQKDFGVKDQYAIYIDQPNFAQFSFGLLPNHEVYRLGKNSLYNKAYIEYLTDIAVALGADPIVAKSDMCDVYEFEAALASSALFEEERRQVNIRYNKITILELSLRYPNIDWLRYLRLVLANANLKVDLNTHVILWASPYYDRLSSILARTSKRTLANYILFRAIQPLLPTLTQHIRYIILRYIATVSGEPEPRLPDRDDFCYQVTNNQMFWITSRLFLERESFQKSVEYTKEISKFVRSILQERIAKANWLSGSSKLLALEKLNSIQDKIGFPDYALEDRFLNKYYDHFQIGKSFFENMEEVLRSNYKNVLKKLVFPPIGEWILRPSTVNALHNLGTSSIEMPLGILGAPFFSNEYPPSMNFGGIGSLIGHEYMHGYDVIGMQFNQMGLISPFLSHKSLTGFAERADCLVNQYSRYFIPEANLPVTNGNKTLNENIADNEALVASFYAYKKWKAVTKSIDGVQGLPFSGEQLYFIQFARTWCTKTTPLFLRKFAFLDHHALNALRVIGPTQNSPEFATAFQCPINSAMNPVNKCRFW